MTVITHRNEPHKAPIKYCVYARNVLHNINKIFGANRRTCDMNEEENCFQLWSELVGVIFHATTHTTHTHTQVKSENYVADNGENVNTTTHANGVSINLLSCCCCSCRSTLRLWCLLRSDKIFRSVINLSNGRTDLSAIHSQCKHKLRGGKEQQQKI